jgi:transketolase C-terminal domain/subunit
MKTKPAPPRSEKIDYDALQLPKLDKNKEYRTSEVITAAMKIFAQDRRIVSIDADLASTSGLEAGVGYVDTGRALNVGIAEPNMMGIGEAYAAMGYNTWVSTFCPFFDWRVLRRIAIGYQERLEAMATKGGWLSEGHGLDITFIATAPNFETNTNGATHMGNDDIVSCPNQLLGIMKWIMEGNKGLIYVRIMRATSGVVYDDDFQFEFGKGYILKESPEDKATIISSGRGVHEALAAASELEQSGLKVGVVDMASIDEKLLLDLYHSAEQNNGFIWPEFQKTLFKQEKAFDISRLLPINCLDADGRPQFIHSATYEELLHKFGLAPSQLVGKIKEKCGRS